MSCPPSNFVGARQRPLKLVRRSALISHVFVSQLMVFKVRVFAFVGCGAAAQNVTIINVIIIIDWRQSDLGFTATKLSVYVLVSHHS
jgi:hypothetical protein